MTKKNWTQKDIRILTELLNNGKSKTYIADYFGVNYAALGMVMYRRGISANRRTIGNTTSTLTTIHKNNKSLAVRIAMLRGEEILINESLSAYFSDKQLKTWYEDPEGYDLFCKEVLNILLQDYQKGMIAHSLNYKRVVICGGRGVGKDFTISALAVYLCIIKPNNKIIIVSPSQRQSDLLYNRILEHIGKNNDLFNSVKKSNNEQCQFANGSIIYSLPSTSYIRGIQNVNYAFMNEASFFERPNEVMNSVEPMLSITDGHLIIMGSTTGKTGILWESYTNPLYQKMKLPTSMNKYVKKSFLAERKKELPYTSYMTEYMAEFSESIDTFFPEALITACSKTYDFGFHPISDCKHYLGVDVGRLKDSSVLTIISETKKGDLKVEGMKTLNVVSFKEQIGAILYLHNLYNFQKICIEKAGLSLQMCEDLKTELRHIIQEFVPTIDSKAESYDYLLKMMEEAKLTLPKKHEKLMFEMRNFLFQITPQGKMKLHHSSELVGDDHIDSLMLAVYASKKYNTNYTYPLA